MMRIFSLFFFKNFPDIIPSQLTKFQYPSLRLVKYMKIEVRSIIGLFILNFPGLL